MQPKFDSNIELVRLKIRALALHRHPEFTLHSLVPHGSVGIGGAPRALRIFFCTSHVPFHYHNAGLKMRLLPKPVNIRHVGTRAPGPKCLPRVPKDEKCELYEHYRAVCINKNRWLDVLIEC